MAKQKRDYPSLKLEFFKSDFDEVKPFITAKGLIHSSERTKRTKGRGKEKKEYKNKILEKALEEQMKKEAEDLTVPVSFLMKAKKNALINIAKKLTKDDGTMNEYTKGLERVKIELGEEVRITRNENINKTDSMKEEDLIDD